MKHIIVELTDQQRQNYIELAEYLNTGITEYDFSMEEYFVETECGTVACALGHAPFVLGHPNVFIDTQLDKKNEWAFDNFNVNVFYDISNCGSPELYDWCFSNEWARVDNTVRGAAARIFYMLEHGVPENYSNQLLGGVPLSYTVEPLPEITSKVLEKV